MLRLPITPLRGLLLGGTLCAGWVVYDLVAFAATGRPQNALEILPGSLAAIAIGALLGWLYARLGWFLALALLVSGAASVLPFVHDPGVSRALLWLPRATLLLTLAYVAGVFVLRLRHFDVLRSGWTLGMLACVAKTLYRHPAPSTYAIGGVATLVLLMGFVSRPALRRIGTTLALAGIGAWLVPRVLADLRPTRGDMPPPTTVAQGPNVIFIVLDTVRADRLSAYGYERDTSPFLDALADESTLYTNLRSTSPFTLPSHASMFTGFFPSEHFALRPGFSARPIRPDLPTLAERFREHGYQTAAVVANDTYVNPTFGLDRGFEHFDDRGGGWVGKYLALAQLTGRALRVGHLSHRDATVITDAALEWLEHGRRDAPFFLFLNYLDAHSPYHPPAPFDRAFGDARPPDPLTPPQAMRSLLYDRELLYLDSELERFVQGLRTSGLYDDTVLLVTADHGEDLHQHDIPEHCWNLYDSLVHIPLIVKHVGERPKAVEDELLNSASLYNLTLELAGLEASDHVPDPTQVGEWYPTVPVNQFYAGWAARTGMDLEANRVAWIDGRVKWIVASNGTVLAFDLDADPDELDPLELNEQQVEAARARARQWWEAHPLPDPDDSELDPELLDKMRALGYG